MDKISDKIWLTRKARINYENRLLQYAAITEYIIPWYSLLIIFIVLIPVGLSKQVIDAVSVLGSIMILVISVIITSKDFKSQAKEIRNQYINLDKIYFEMHAAEQISDANKLNMLYSSYLDEIKKTENHSYWDYLKIRIDLAKPKKRKDQTEIGNPTGREWIIYISHCLIKVLVTIVLFVGLPGTVYLLLK